MSNEYHKYTKGKQKKESISVTYEHSIYVQCLTGWVELEKNCKQIPKLV